MELTSHNARMVRGGPPRHWLLLLALASLLASGSYAESKGVVNVNTASVAELTRLPGIGESKAAAIVSARESNGGFRSVDDLLAVKGIGAQALEKIRGKVVLKGATTLKD
ncbi:MAG: helix-hairpin-helix domain-containing protein [Myxococcales bacterium]|nr:helix-hairpin-helix domain-containing protein [Myxococcales bacterium]